MSWGRLAPDGAACAQLRRSRIPPQHRRFSSRHASPLLPLPLVRRQPHWMLVNACPADSPMYSAVLPTTVSVTKFSFAILRASGDAPMRLAIFFSAATDTFHISAISSSPARRLTPSRHVRGDELFLPLVGRWEGLASRARSLSGGPPGSEGGSSHLLPCSSEVLVSLFTPSSVVIMKNNVREAYCEHASYLPRRN